MTVKDPAENKVTRRDGRIEGKTEDIREIKRRGTSSADDRQRMQENRKVQLLNARKNWLKQRIVEIALVDVRAHVDAAYSWQLARSIQFIDRTIRKEHRQRQKSEQPSRIFHMRGTGPIVPGAGEFVREVFIAPMCHWPGE